MLQKAIKVISLNDVKSNILIQSKIVSFLPWLYKQEEQGWRSGEHSPPSNVAEFISNHGIDPKHGLISGLSKVASCQQKTLPTWLVWAGYSAWQFFTDGIFLNKIFLDWLLTLTTQPSASKLSDNPVSLLLVLPEFFCYERFFSLYSGFPLSSKTNISKFQFIQNGRQKTHLCGCATSKLLQCIYLFIYLSIYLFIYLYIYYSKKKGARTRK